MLKSKYKCKLCNGLGITKYVDFNELSHLSYGEYDLNELINIYGKKEICDCVSKN